MEKGREEEERERERKEGESEKFNFLTYLLAIYEVGGVPFFILEPVLLK